MPTGLHSHLIIKAIKLACHKIKGFQDEVKCKTVIGYQSGSSDLKIYMFTIQPYLSKKTKKKNQGAHGHITHLTNNTHNTISFINLNNIV